MTGWIIGGIVVLIIFFVIAQYNGLIQLRNRVDNGWAQIDVQLRRRYDLIPNLVESVKGYAAHERELLTAVTAARSAAAGSLGDPAKAAQADNALTGVLRQLFAVVENYPQVKADANFRQLQEELSATESKIAFARQFYNDTVMMFNTKIGLFPANLIASSFGFRSRTYFEAEGDSRGPVNVKF